MAPSKVLLIGATGYIGKHVALASAKQGHETFALVRTLAPSDPAKAELLEKFKAAGITLIEGDIADRATLVAALKRVDAVVSTVGPEPTLAQIGVVEAAKEAGTIKRFLPSEFGNDPDRQELDVEVTKGLWGPKVQVRRALEKSGIPYTFLCLGAFAGYYLYPIVQDARAPPREGKLLVLGDGDARAVFAAEEDVAAFAVRTIDDPRAENKTVHFRPGPNVASTNEVIALWEKKLGRTFEKEFLDREGVLQSIAALPFPDNLMRAIKYSIFVKGDQTSFALDPAKDVEATALYPDVKYTTIDEYLSRLVLALF